MSRRKQSNPNKVIKLMESGTEEQRAAGGGDNSHVNGEEAELNEDKPDNHITGASNGVVEREKEVNGGESLQNGDRGGGTDEGEIAAGGGGGDLSSINAMMSAVMSAAGTINGGGASVDSTHTSSTGPSPSPSPNKTMTTPTRAPSASRNARRNQETKDEGSQFICPLCDKNCMTQHQLTMHIRQHNADTGATDHSCSICGKALSSASSLDRHMLVHSGERPYKCSVCGQTFTTNGNMHRHMKIHEKDPSGGAVLISPPSPTKRRRPPTKRRPGPEEENGEEPPSKKVQEDSVMEEATPGGRGGGGAVGGGEELLPCPICFKTCSSRSELDAHMDTHPDTTLRCDVCCVSFRTHRGLLRHNAAVHKLLPQDPSGRPFIQNNPSIPTGFNDLAFIDFSCKKFPHIAQVWCEINLRRCVSKFHRFVCDSCDKAFPLRSALERHYTAVHQDKTSTVPTTASGGTVETAAEKMEVGSMENGVDDSQSGEDEVPPPEQAGFLESLGLQHISKVKTGPTDDQIHQAHLDSIKVIHAEPPSSTFPQEPASACQGGGLGLGLGGLGALGGLGLGIPLLEAAASASGSSLQGLTREALGLLSLQPFQGGFLLQAEGGAAAASAASSGVKPGEAGGNGLMELADIQQILRVATAAPNQMGLSLPPLAKAPGFVGSQGQAQAQKSMPPLKPKPPITPRSSLTASTPPPLQSSQQASLGCISPSLPPPTTSFFKTPSSSSSSSSSGNQMEADCMGDAHTPSSDSPPATSLQEEGGVSGRKPGGKAGGGTKGQFPCRFCDQVFAFSGVLQAHMRFHLGILPHQCNICDYVAPDKATLIRHLRTHSGERPYVCRVCHYPFTVKANCERHLRKKHAKTSRKEIEKNIKYVTSSAGATVAAAVPGGTIATPDALEPSSTETACRFCGEDLKTYRALQIHLRTHNGCQRKPFECRRCGAAFLAKRNCIHHLLKQHPEVQEREIEDHIATLLPATVVATAARTATATTAPLMLNGLNQSQSQVLQQLKVEEVAAAVNTVYTACTELDQPLDFSTKGRGASSQSGSPGIKLESLSPGFDCSTLDQPIDLSIPSKRQRRDATGGGMIVERREIKTEPASILMEQQHALALTKAPQVEEKSLPPLHPHPQPGCYQLPPGSSAPTSLSSLNTRTQRLKPLLPKPSTSSTSSSLKDLPPLASIAQIIHSVSGAPELLKREAVSVDTKPQGGLSSPQANATVDAPGTSVMATSPTAQSDDVVDGTARKRSRKKLKDKAAATVSVPTLSSPGLATGSGIDLESSGEFASVEKMLATTDTNKFSPFLQTGAGDMSTRRDAESQSGGAEDKDGVGEDNKPAVLLPQSKGKKNAYSNSVQKMTCPFCPRVFPWASSLQRHMLTHTGQKPFPCPKCDAFFSTKSNCERHLLRKHGVTNRTLRRNGNLSKRDDDGSHESAESQSETEQNAPEAVDLSGSNVSDCSSTPDQKSGSSDQPRVSPGSRASRPSPASRSNQGLTSSSAEQQSVDLCGQQVAAQGPSPQHNNTNTTTKEENEDDDDSHSNKSLDLNFASKLIDFKFTSTSAPSSGVTEQHTSQATPAPATTSTSASIPTGETESLAEQREKEKLPPAVSSSTSSQVAATASPPAATPPTKPQPEYKHVCRVCKKSFRYATTLARHERAHLCEETPAPPVTATAEEDEEEAKPAKEEETTKTSKHTEPEREEEPKETEDEEMDAEERGAAKGESEESEDEEEKGSDEEGGASETKGDEGGSKTDKRKKICNVCTKRFWSLQDLTRHMRSHTGERPYQCQTCERTFTLKHSLVRHQRIHLKPRGSEGAELGEAGSAAGAATGFHGDASEDGDSASCTPNSTCPPSENESEGGSGVGAKEEEEEEEEEERGEEEEEEEEEEKDPESKEAVNTEESQAKMQAQSEKDAEPSPPKKATSEPPPPQAGDAAPAEPLQPSTAGGPAHPDPQALPEPATQQTAATEAPGGQTTGSNAAPKDPASGDQTDAPRDPPSSSPPAKDPTDAQPEGFIQGLLEIHAKPSLEHILPSGEATLVGVE